MTTYDQIITSFIINCKVRRDLIPQDENILKEWIQNAIKMYNVKTKPYEESFNTPIAGDDFTEEINVSLTDGELLVLSFIMKLVFLRNERISFATKYAVFQKEFGINNYNAQIKGKAALEESVEMQIEKTIRDIRIPDWEVY